MFARLRHKMISDWPKRFRQKHMILVMALIVGFCSGLVAVLLKNGVYGIQRLLTSGLAEDQYNFLYVAFPLVGLLITLFIIRKVLKREMGPGIPSVLYAISRRKSTLKRKDMFSSIVTSIFTVGFGGSAGLEAPTVQASAAIGSNIGAGFKLDYKTKTLLIACAAAGSLASIFKAPVAAIIFAVEVIMIDLTTASLVPLLLASISALLTANWFLGEDTLLRFHLRDAFEISTIPFYVLFGLFAGVCSLYFNKFYLAITNTLERIKNRWSRVLIGGSLLGIIVFFFPALYGEGYDVINSLLSNDLVEVTRSSFFHDYTNSITMMLIFMACLVIFKVVATALTIGSGGVGGIFAPTLFMGATLGFLFTRVFRYFDIKDLSASNFTLVGMAGLMAGVLHAPLTAIFMIAEITGGYDLFIPLMVTSAIAYYTSKSIAPHTIYTSELAKRGDLITHNKDQAVLTLMNLRDEIETSFFTIDANSTLRELVAAVRKSTRNLFPVVNPQGQLVGVVTLDDIRKIMFDQSQYDVIRVHELMTVPPEIIHITDNMDIVMKKFEDSGAWNLPVVENEKYVGFVSKSRLFNAYRTLLRGFSHD
jgi:chloride channel protein, CIC family